jgi:hypothetical protein
MVEQKLAAMGLKRSRSQIGDIIRQLIQTVDEDGNYLLTKNARLFSAQPAMAANENELVSKISNELRFCLEAFPVPSRSEVSAGEAIILACLRPRSPLSVVEKTMHRLKDELRSFGLEPDSTSVRELHSFLSSTPIDELMEKVGNHTATPGHDGLPKLMTAQKITQILLNEFPELNQRQDFRDRLANSSSESRQLLTHLISRLTSIKGVGFETVRNILFSLEVNQLIIDTKIQEWLRWQSQSEVPLPSHDLTYEILLRASERLQVVKTHNPLHEISYALAQLTRQPLMRANNSEAHHEPQYPARRQQRQNKSVTPMESTMKSANSLLEIGRFIEKLSPERVASLFALFETAQRFGADSHEFSTAVFSYLRPEIEAAFPPESHALLSIDRARSAMEEHIQKLSQQWRDVAKTNPSYAMSHQGDQMNKKGTR